MPLMTMISRQSICNWENGISEEKHRVCFAEYNPERGAGQELCVGAYKFGEKNTYHYAPFNKVEGDA